MGQDQKHWAAFWSQLQQRKIFHVAVSYAVGAFVLIQIADATFEALSLPPQAIPWLLAAMFFFFPFVVAISWFYEISPSGLVRDVRFRELPRPGEAYFLAALFTVSFLLTGFFGWLSQTGETSAVRIASGRPTIAVMPFQDFSSERGGLYLGNGIADQLLRVLDGLAEFDVVGRTSSFALNNQGLDIRSIGDVLGADHVVEGSIVLEEPKVLVTVQLIETASALHVWSMAYERTLDSIIDLELEIAHEIARSLSIALSDTSSDALDEHETADPEAYLYYLQGKEYLRRPASEDSLEFAYDLFQQALLADPDMRSAEVGLCQTQLALYRVVGNPEHYRNAVSICLKVAGRNGSSADAHIALGDLYRMVGNTEEAGAEYGNALMVAPDSARALQGLARVQQAQDRIDLAEASFLRSIAAEPAWAYTHRGYGFFLARLGRFEEAAEQFRKATTLAPDDLNAFANLGNAYFDAGAWKEAHAAFDRALAIKRTAPVLGNYATLLYYEGDYERAASMLEEAETISAPDYWYAAKLGAVYRQQHKTAASRSAFQRAIRLAVDALAVAPDDAYLLAYIATFHANLGEFDTARVYIDRARNADPGDSSVPYFAAVVHQLAGSAEVPGLLREAIDMGYPTDTLAADPLLQSVYRSIM